MRGEGRKPPRTGSFLVSCAVELRLGLPWNRRVKLGSAPLLIRKGLTESLAGRFEVLHLPHWSYPEMREAFGFSLEQYLYFGAYPRGQEILKVKPQTPGVEYGAHDGDRRPRTGRGVGGPRVSGTPHRQLGSVRPLEGMKRRTEQTEASEGSKRARRTTSENDPPGRLAARSFS